MSDTKTVVALVGNPNCGKTTLFNELTGSNYDVGNRIGVTVESKKGICRYNKNMLIVDLPGIYSLSPNSAEEIITHDFIINEKPDLILNIVDATNLERNLYLTTQLAETGVPMVIALNMADAVKKNGFEINANMLTKRLNIPSVPISASKCIGIEKLIKECNLGGNTQNQIKYNAEIERAISALCLKNKISRFYAIQLTEKNDTETHIAQARYKFIKSVAADCVKIIGQNRQFLLTEKIDSIAMHPLFAIPIFILVMFCVFQITFGTFGSMMSDMLDTLFNVQFANMLENILTSAEVGAFFKGLLLDGIISGIGSVITFFPQIMLLFLFLSFLEDSGYMARTAFIMDKLFIKIGLSGKSFVPMIMGFGCSVPATMAVRTLDNERDRKLTMLLIPFMSCGAKMPVYAVFTAALFPNNAGIVTFSLYILGIALGIISGLILSNTVFKGDEPPLILELPPYRMPTFKSTFNHMWDKVKDFLTRVGTVILLASIIIWLLENLDFHLHLTADSEYSIIGTFGKLIAPIFKPCGFGNWKVAVSLISGFAAKEAVVSTMSILYGAYNTADLVLCLTTSFTPLSAYSFLTFVLLYVPCIAAVSTLRSELNSRKLTSFSVLYQLSVAWIMSTLVFQIGNLFV